MRSGIGIGGAQSGRERNWPELVRYVTEAERLGVDDCWNAEAWGLDAVTPLAFLAGQTSRIRLGTSIAQISARVPSMTAMTALTMAALSGDRFVLGLGVSGPQVVEGLHGARFAMPLTRLREYLDILDLAFAGEKLAYSGSAYTLPLPGGEGKALRLAQPPNPAIPVYLATLGPKGLELTGERADGWLGTSFVPEAAEAFLAPMRAGAERAGRTLADIDIQAGGHLEFSDDVAPMLPALKRRLAFSLGAMGSPTTNFYNRAYQRGGYSDAAAQVQRLWVDGHREEAVAAVPDEMALRTSLIGTDDMVLDRLRAYRDAGVTTIRFDPGGDTVTARLDTLARGLDLVRRLEAEAQPAAAVADS
jgi:F420-dependent oxidoreductase-like protein